MEIQCKYCKKKITVNVDESKYSSWKNGEGFIQDLMPELSAGEREILISRTCDSCFDEIFLGANSGEE
jgi:hypothetical protein